MADSAAAPSTPAAQAAAARLAGMRPPPKAVPSPAAGDAAGPGSGPSSSPAGSGAEKGKKKDKKGKEGKEKRKLPTKWIAVGVAVLAVGFVVKGKVMKPHYGPGHPAPPGQVVSLGQVTTNLSDGHLAQIDVSIRLSKPASTKTVDADQTELVSTVVSELGRQTYSGLLNPAGRTALGGALLRSFQQELGTTEGAPVVMAVYLTGFVLQ